MAHITVTQRIEILIFIGCVNNTRTQQEVCNLFNAKYPDNPITQSTVSKIASKFRETDDDDFVKLACLWITEVIHVLVRCAQLKELLLLPKVCVKTQEPQLVTEHNNLIEPGRQYTCTELVLKMPDKYSFVPNRCRILQHWRDGCAAESYSMLRSAFFSGRDATPDD
ncbi:hypothetical protein NQ318_003309 [Aromia moschata]|uniref:DUF4817 domain-containing protein n=1 Tax=Aromia moschata TaxID=1265417 RepID=A0AAV8YNM0_9CUCU|nr:hypothetical protein NQ318_003309 [Aromia moschata]